MSHLARVMRQRLAAIDNVSLYADIENPLVHVLARMEHLGIQVDRDALGDIKTRLTAEAADLTARLYDIAGKQFNVNSTNQLREILYEDRGLTPGKKTKTGYSTDAATLEKTVQRWNGFCAQERDDDFGRTLMLTPIAKGPFYAVELSPSMLNTQGGSVWLWDKARPGELVCQAGADVLNDAWGGVDPLLAKVAGDYGVGIVCTHAGGQQPRTRPHRVTYDDLMTDIITTTTNLAERAVAAGVPRESVLVDPGHDFGKNTRHSLEATRRLDELIATGWPVLVSLSNKDFVGETLNRGVEDRLIGTLATTAVSAWLGARVFRAHNVAETSQVLHMVSAIRGNRPPAVARRGLA